MSDFHKEVLWDLKLAIDAARTAGVVCEYPRGALIDGEWIDWPFDLTE